MVGAWTAPVGEVGEVLPTETLARWLQAARWNLHGQPWSWGAWLADAIDGPSFRLLLPGVVT